MVHPNFKLTDQSLLCETGWVDGKPAKSIHGRAAFPVYDPATDQVWAHQETMDEDDTDAAIAVATAAFPPWSKTTAQRRARLLLELDRLFREARGDLAQLIVLETGKALPEAYAEVDYAASYTWLMAGECERIQGEIVKHTSNNSMRFIITHQPIGPVGILTPWNFPVVIALRKISTALAAGCTMVVKPSPETPITTSAIAILCQRAGIPDGVVNVVTASSETTPVVGKKLCEDPRLKKISFTGSTPIGKLLMQQCSSTLKKLTLELGGNGGFMVFDDADLEVASTCLVANKFRAAGQVCMCANRVFVHQSILEKFTSLVEAKIRKLRFGHGLDEGVTNGPLTTRRGAERAEQIVKDALQHGAKLVLGGKRFGSGYHFEPSIIVGASKDSRAYNEEVFAPICAIYPFENEAEVIRLVNDTPMGLTNYVFTTNISRAFRVTEALDSGTVAVNTAMANAAESPFGGIKESGMGKEGGLGHGVEEFVITKAMALTI